ncbi:MAG: hypothetical protein LBT25_02755 [Candidatus Symbiothrix sp.]|jgi:hypothetical protein|nr:hypothetical protein [Candidatus Symbiothrix sp.]
MSQLYVPDGTWTLCTEGKKPAKIKVQSQTTVRISGTRLAAVETDRFDGNFTCLKMVMAAALVGALVGAAIALTGGLALGGILAAVAVGSATGAVAGKLASVIPSVCSILTCGSQWTVLHDNTRFEKKKALLQQATLNCLLGGLITIEMKNLRMARDMSMLCAHIYGNGANLPDGYIPCPPDELPDNMKDMTKNPWVSQSGFKARLYKSPTGGNILIFEGTDFTSGKDWANNLKQGVGLESEQYQEAVKLVTDLKRNGVELEAVGGHSLGGGLAALAGPKAGAPTYTYNAAGVHPNTYTNNGVNPDNAKNIQAYSGDHDILTAISDNREIILGRISPLTYLLELNGALPRNNGQRIELETDASWFPNPAEGHSVNYIKTALEKEMAQQGKQVDVIAQDK